MRNPDRWTRRHLLQLTLGAGTLLLAPRAWAADCAATPPQTEGPFYPPQFGRPGNDLIRTGPGGAQPRGEVIRIAGRVTDALCQPVPGAVVEIWQADANGHYAHPGDAPPAQRDPHFRYWGAAVVAADGSYGFRTLQPAPYRVGWGSWRTPHIHFKVYPPPAKPGAGRAAGLDRPLTTQMYFAGHELNGKDFLLRRVPEPERPALIATPVAADPDAASDGRTVWQFDLVLA